MTLARPAGSPRRAALLWAAAVPAAAASFLLLRSANAPPPEAITEMRGVMLIRWRPDQEPILQYGGSVSEAASLQQNGAKPLAVMDIRCSRAPDQSSLLAWFGLAHDSSKTETWFNPPLNPEARRRFETSARDMLAKSQWAIADLDHGLLERDGRSLSLRYTFFRRTPAALLGAIAAVLFLLGARSAFIAARLRSRTRKGLCPHCGYPRAGEGPCPECGAA